MKRNTRGIPFYICQSAGCFCIPADTVTVSFGMKPNNGIVEAICEKYPTTAVVGDCTGVGQVGEAVRGGFFAAGGLH